jgi:21S rRNA (GM2251-2'-O)-methyltransferase
LSSKKELLYGTHSIEAALTSRSRTRFHAFYAVGTKGEEESQNKAQDQAIRRRGRLARLASDANVPVHWLSRQELNNLLPPNVSGTAGGVALDCSPLENIPFIGRAEQLEEICTNAAVDNNVVLILDEMSDPQNLGATLRCACFLGAAGVVISAKNSAPLSPTVSRGKFNYTTDSASNDAKEYK